MNTPRVILKAKRAAPFFARHPWVFGGAIDRVEGELVDGAEVDVLSHANHFFARGLYNGRSKIQVRLYCWEPDRPLDDAFFRQRLETAIRFRERLGLRGPEKGCRLVFSESDGLSGLTIDEYAGWLAIQFTALGMVQRKELLLDLLEELIRPNGIYLRTEKGIGQLEGIEQHDGVLRGPSPPAELMIEENGLRFRVNLAEGQKTGFYLDQRDNRSTVAKLARNRTVLDAFCYSGAFGLHAARSGADSVECVDSSEQAIALARANAELNQLQHVSFVRADVFDHLESCARDGRRFGMVILDPPKFARSRNSINQALRGYQRLQTLALRLLDSDGIMVTCCCSGLIDAPMLQELLAQIAVHERREVQIIGSFGQTADHPVLATCPETSYLKCLVSRVM